MELKSTISYRIYLAALLFATLIYLIIHTIKNGEQFLNPASYHFAFPFLLIMLSLSAIVLLVGTLMKAYTTITISETSISKKIIFSTTKNYKWENIDGYYITIERSRFAQYEALVLFENNVRVLHIPQFHISNYSIIKNLVEKHLRNLGERQFAYSELIKDYLV